MLNVGRLRVLREVARTGSMSGAAEALTFSQPAISHQVAKLEEETGTKLIERVPRGVRLTEAGELLVRHADLVLGRLERAESELADLLSLRRGRLRLGAFPSAFVQLVPAAIAELRAEHPGVEVVLGEVGREDASEKIESGHLDLAVVWEYDFAPSEAGAGLRRTPLLDDAMYLVLAQDHPAARLAHIRLEDLRDDGWISVMQGGPASRAIYRTFSEAGFEPRVVFETDNLLTVQGLVAAGVGVSLVPGMVLPTLRQDIAVRSLGGDVPTRHVFALAAGEGERSPAEAPMLAILADQGARLRRDLEELVAANAIPGDPSPALAPAWADGLAGA